MVFRSLIRGLLLGVLAVAATDASAQSSLPPLKGGAGVAIDGGPATLTIAPKGANGTEVRLPWPVQYIVDVAVQAGGNGEVMITLVTQEQYNALAAGRQPQNQQPPIKAIISGRGSASAVLPKGDYFLAFSNTSGTPLEITYRTSYLRR